VAILLNDVPELITHSIPGHLLYIITGISPIYHYFYYGEKMKKIVLTVAALAIIATPIIASAASDAFYVKGNIGLGLAMDTDVDNMPELAGTATVTYDSGFLLTGAAGYDFFGPMRLELEYLWQKNDVDTLRYKNRIGDFDQGDLKTQSFMLNGYYDIDTGSAWMPFVGAGIGWSKLDLSTPALPFGDNDDVFTYQFIGGVAYNFSVNFAVDVHYRFMGTSDATIDGADFNLNSNDLMLGFRYSF
jgi:opacity protein-like surface antigen